MVGGDGRRAARRALGEAQVVVAHAPVHRAAEHHELFAVLEHERGAVAGGREPGGELRLVRGEHGLAARERDDLAVGDGVADRQRGGLSDRQTVHGAPAGSEAPDVLPATPRARP
jgi:hypothetical protein